ncbi:MAG: salicylate synthase [Desulfobacterium sp.]|nr:salicylate synthase [Desulfobacterium sp.]
MESNTCFSIEAAQKYEALGYWEPLTLGEHLKEWSRQFKNRTALVEGDKRLTYSEFHQKVNALAAGFVHMGITKGDNVVVQLPNSISFVVTLFAMFRIGAVPVLAMPAHREAELAGIFEIAKPTAYIIPETYLGFNYVNMARGLLEKYSSVKYLLKDSIDQDIFTRNGLVLKSLNVEFPSHRDMAVLLLSGGTTGTPKLIPRTHADYAYNAKMSAQKCCMDLNSVYLAVLPIAHNFPLACPGIIGTFFSGGKVVLSRTTSYDEAFPLIEREKVTITAVVPAMASLWLQALEWDTTDISSLELLQIGGSTLDENLARQIMPMMKCRLQQVFGMAEGLVCYTDLRDDDHTIMTCQGKPLSVHDEIKIVDENGDEVKKGETGELLVRGPYTIRGYYRAFEQNQKDFTRDGFYKSGDTVSFTDDGNLCVKGRIKEQINRAGEKIVAAEIETHLNSYPGIKDSALVAVPDEHLGERSCAFVISDRQDIPLPRIHDYFRTLGIAGFKMPDQLEFIDFWPLTSVGKIDKKKLLSLVLEKEKRSYYETRLPFNHDPLFTACRLIEVVPHDNYLLYENKEEWSLGLGIDSLLKVDFKNTILETPNKTHVFENNDLSRTLEKALSGLPYEDWRGYGTADFELSYHNHRIEFPNPDKTLLKLFIPKAEIRFSNGEVLLRALEKQDLKDLEVILGSIVSKCPKVINTTDLGQKIEDWASDIPEINTCNSETYKDIVRCAVEEIREPQYQKVILSRKIPLNREIDMVASYFAGRNANTPARSYILKIGDFKAAGFSPETLVEVDENRIVSTQPLAGTRSIGTDDQEEIKLREELLNNSKEIAEHAVSIKLAFEEMRQVCDKDSISLSDFMTIARRGTVQHLASRLNGKLKEGYNPWHAFNALFPAVTATGIPKKESIQAIDKYETDPRGLYSGCVITYDVHGKMDAALVLRSFFQEGQKAWLRAGAGIVDLSDPARELEETCEKLRSVSNQIVYI